MTLKVFMTEPKKTDYVFIDEHGNLHVLFPVTGGEAIGTDQTCKMYLELKSFLGLKSDDVKPKMSAQNLLLDYQKALIKDIESLILYNKSDDPRLNAKRMRLAQLKEYLDLIKEIETSWSQALVREVRAPDYHKFDKKITDIFAKKTNFLSMRLSPFADDLHLVADHPIFSVARRPRDAAGSASNDYAGLGPTLRKVFFEQLHNKNKKYNNKTKDLIIKGIAEGFPSPKQWDAASVGELQKRIEEYFKNKLQTVVNCRERSDIDITTKKKSSVAINYAYLTQTLYLDLDGCTPQEVITYILQSAFAEEFINGLKPSPFIPDTTIDTVTQAEIINKERLELKINTLWDLIGDYRSINAKAFFNTSPYKEEVYTIANDCITQNKSLENELFALVNNKYAAQLGLRTLLSEQDKAQILNLYTPLSLLFSSATSDALAKESDKLSIKTQFFLAQINIYCYAHNLLDRKSHNFGAIFDQDPYRNEIANTVFNNISQGESVESALFALINSPKYRTALSLKRELTQGEQSHIVKRFNYDYQSIARADHFDEFSLFLPEVEGDCFNYEYKLCFHMAEILSPDQKYPLIRAAAKALKDKKATVLPLPSSKSEPDFIEIPDDGVAYLIQGNIVNLLKTGQFPEAEKLLMIRKRTSLEWDEFIQQHRAALLPLLNTQKDIERINQYDAKDHSKGTSLLIHAAKFGLNELVALLLKIGVEIDVKDKNKDTALLWAIDSCQPKIIAQLLEKNADITIMSSYNENALTLATKRHRESIKPILLKAIKLSADKQSDLMSKVGHARVLSFVALEAPQLFDEIIGQIDPKQLLEEIKHFKEFSDSHIALKLKDKLNSLTEKVTTLTGDDLNACIAKLITYLQDGQFDLVKQLLFTKNNQKKSLADLLKANGNTLQNIINTKQIRGKDTSDTLDTTLLINAVQRNDIADVRLLLRLGAEINSADSNKQTALHHALSDNYHSIVETLLESDAKPNLKNAQGQDALTLANIHSPRSIKYLIISAMRLTADEQQEFLNSLPKKLAYPRIVIYAALVDVDIFDASAFDELVVYLDPAQKIEEIKQLTEYLKLHPEAPITSKVTKLLEENLSFESFDDLKFIIENNILPILLKAGKFDFVRQKLNEKNEQRVILWDVLNFNYPQAVIASVNTKNNNGDTLLMDAIRRESFADVELYLGLGADANTQNNDNATPLYLATFKKDPAIEALLIEHNANISPDILSKSRAQHGVIRKALLQKLINLSPNGQKILLARIENGAYPSVLVYIAAAKPEDFNEMLALVKPQHLLEEIQLVLGHPNIGAAAREAVLRKLIDFSDDALEDFIKSSSLTNYLKAGQFDMVRTILFTKNSQGKSLYDVLLKHDKQKLLNILNTKQEVDNSKLSVKGASLLAFSAAKNHPDDVRLLLKLGVEINSIDYFNDTPLSWAVEKGHKPIVTLLLEKNPHLHYRNGQKLNVLDIATKYHPELLIDLLKKAIQLSPAEQQQLSGDYSRIFIYTAIKHPKLFNELATFIDPNQLADEIKALITYLGSHPTPIETEVANFLLAKMPTSSADEINDFIKSKLLVNLLKAGQFNIVDSKLFGKNAEQQPLYEALMNQNKSALVEILHTTDKNGDSLFFNAVKNQKLNVLTLYLTLGADINAKDKYGSTALMSTRNPQIAELLLEKNADICIRNNTLENVFELAIAHRPELIKPLLFKAIKLSTETQAELLNNISDGNGGSFQNILNYTAKMHPEYFEELLKGIEPEQFVSEIKKYTKLLNEEPSYQLTPEILSALCEKTLALSPNGTEQEGIGQFIERVSDIKDFLLSLIKNKHEELSRFIETCATEDERTYANACCKYITHLNKEIASNPTDSLADTKRIIVLDALRVLLTQRKTTDAETRIGNFAEVLTVNKNTLCTRRDTALTTFIKALGVLGAFIFGLGVGGYFAYQSFFGENAMTKGRGLLEILPEKGNDAPKV